MLTWDCDESCEPTQTPTNLFQAQLLDSIPTFARTGGSAFLLFLRMELSRSGPGETGKWASGSKNLCA
jgi:hypothetical protein